jgi:predicted signal transduction protein with EAL and GGDEF domain
VIGVSVGVARTGPLVSTAEQLLRHSDLAMYSAKAAQRGSRRSLL